MNIRYKNAAALPAVVGVGGVAKQRGVNKEHDCLLDFHAGRGPVTTAKLHECLKPVLPDDVLLISDSAPSYRRFAQEAGITHEANQREHSQ